MEMGSFFKSFMERISRFVENYKPLPYLGVHDDVAVTAEAGVGRQTSQGQGDSHILQGLHGDLQGEHYARAYVDARGDYRGHQPGQPHLSQVCMENFCEGKWPYLNESVLELEHHRMFDQLNLFLIY